MIVDDRYYAILEVEFNLKREVDRLREAKLGKLAELLEMLVLALTAKPPRWEAAAKLAKCLADDGYGTDRQLEHVRNTLIRALAPDPPPQRVPNLM